MPVAVAGRLGMLGAVAALAALPAAAGAQAAPEIPGSQTERFRVVVEGTSSAVTDTDLGAKVGNCSWTVNAHQTESATYLRGRGVVVEFIRIGTGPRAPIVLRRPGRFVAPTLTVVGTIRRTSSGAAVRTGPTECVPATEDLSTGPDCDKDLALKQVVGLTLTQNFLRLRLSPSLPGLAAIDCPLSQIYGGSPDMRYAWPTPPPLRTELLPPRRIFGSERVILVRMQSGRPRTGGPFVAGPLSGQQTHFGHTRATIRFIRLT